MNIINNKNIVEKQYKTATNLSTRISIHDKYSVNKMGFGNWIVSNYDIKLGYRILELGCGTGDMWKGHISILDNIDELVLSDFSEGMLDRTRENLGNIKNVSYKVIDIQDIPFEDNSFDIAIANMMLYHVPDLDKGLSEVSRVLKDNGIFYCATFGEHGIIEYISSLLKNYGTEDKVNKNFTLQNGEGILGRYFEDVTKLDYEDALDVTNLEDLIDYVFSLSSMTNLSSVKSEDIKQILESKTVNGVLHVPKEYGMFVCK